MGRRKKATKRSHIGVVQDKSGSMSSRYEETISGYNQFIDQLKAEDDGNTFVTLVQFDTRKTTVYEQTALADVPKLDGNSYVAGGMTALNDGVGEAISRMEKFVNPGDNVAVTIMTDGGENSSSEFNLDAIKALIKKKEEEGWEFNYLGAGPQAWAGAAFLGIAASHVINYDSSPESHELAYAALAASSSSKMRGRSASYAVSAPSIKSQLESTPSTTDVQHDVERFGFDARGQAVVMGPKPRKRVPKP